MSRMVKKKSCLHLWIPRRHLRLFIFLLHIVCTGPRDRSSHSMRSEDLVDRQVWALFLVPWLWVLD